MRLATTSTSIPQCNYLLFDDIILQTGVLLKPVFLLIKEWEYIYDKVQLRTDQSDKLTNQIGWGTLSSYNPFDKWNNYISLIFHKDSKERVRFSIDTFIA